MRKSKIDTTIQYNGHNWHISRGYYINNKLGKLHRYIWEQHNGCKIPNGYCIHHKDEDKLNNDINNLILMEHGEHTELHAQGRFHTQETKEKMSIAKKGIPLFNGGSFIKGHIPKHKVIMTEEIARDVQTMDYKEFITKYKCSIPTYYRLKKDMVI